MDGLAGQPKKRDVNSWPNANIPHHGDSRLRLRLNHVIGGNRRYAMILDGAQDTAVLATLGLHSNGESPRVS